MRQDASYLIESWLGYHSGIGLNNHSHQGTKSTINVLLVYVVNWVFTPGYNPKFRRTNTNPFLRSNMSVINNKYLNFIGVDVAKNELVVAAFGDQETYTYPNNNKGFRKFFNDHNLQNTLVALEATGGYENKFCDFLLDKNISVHKSNPRQIKNFIRSFGIISKTDESDAKAIAYYAKERASKLRSLEKIDPNNKALLQLVNRREELVKTRAAEKNRLKAPDNDIVKESIIRLINILNEEIENLEARIKLLVSEDKKLNKHREILKTIPGIGDNIAVTLIAKLPELGLIGNKQISALCGVAPYCFDSGNKQGYRKTKGGRVTIKKSLFIAALTAARAKNRFGEYYRDAVARGKNKMKALIALMHKIIIVANARIKQFCLSGAYDIIN